VLDAYRRLLYFRVLNIELHYWTGEGAIAVTETLIGQFNLIMKLDPSFYKIEEGGVLCYK